jgi:hypothetical protein
MINETLGTLARDVGQVIGKGDVREMSKCKIRPDLLEQNLSTDIWKDWSDGNPHVYLNDPESFSYRHLDDQFQILWACDWWNANEIDFEFLQEAVI